MWNRYICQFPLSSSDSHTYKLEMQETKKFEKNKSGTCLFHFCSEWKPKSWRTEPCETGSKAGTLLPRTCCHLWLLTLPWPQESLETGIHHWGFEKAALHYWATGFIKLSLLSYLWCLSALQPTVKWYFLSTFLPSILYIFTLDSLMSVLSQTQMTWRKKVYVTYMCMHTSSCAPRTLRSQRQARNWEKPWFS